MADLGESDLLGFLGFRKNGGQPKSPSAQVSGGIGVQNLKLAGVVVWHGKHSHSKFPLGVQCPQEQGTLRRHFLCKERRKTISSWCIAVD